MRELDGFRERFLGGRLSSMSYVLEKTPLPADRSRIDVADPREVKWWSKLLGCSTKQLLEAVARAGDSAAKVERLLDGWVGLGWNRDGLLDAIPT
jgi:hypothetical protein